MRALTFRPLAIADLDSVWTYTEENWGPRQAVTYNELIEQTIQALRQAALPGTSAQHVRDNYRKQSVGQHMIYFRFSADQLEIVRILHQRQDALRHL